MSPPAREVGLRGRAAGGDVLDPGARRAPEVEARARAAGRRRRWPPRGRRSARARRGAAGPASGARRRPARRSRRPSRRPVEVWIWALMPSTRPRPSSSGPPELPWLIAASVWIAPVVSKPVSDWIERSERGDDADRERLLLAERAADGGHRRADVQVRRSSRAAAGAASGRRGRSSAARRRRTGRSPTICAGTWLPSAKRTKTSVALLMSAPVAARDDVRVGGDLAVAGDDEARAQAGRAAAAGLARPVEMTVTTPGDSRW